MTRTGRRNGRALVGKLISRRLARDRPVELALALTAVFFVAGKIRAQEATPSASRPPGGAEAPKHERRVSAHAAALLAAGLPKYEALAPVAAMSAAKTIAVGETDPSANGIVRLPRYVVHEPRMPTPLEVMTRKERENFAMNRYLGPENGLDRGFLNLFTLVGVWWKIPVLRSIPFVPFGSVTNEARAMQRLDEDGRKRKMSEVIDLTSLTRKAGDPAGANKIKDATEQTFLRHSD